VRSRTPPLLRFLPPWALLVLVLGADAGAEDVTRAAVVAAQNAFDGMYGV
jgi:hypothetical protein